MAKKVSQKNRVPSKETPWFCFDGEQFEYFATKKEAQEAADLAIDYYFDEFWDDAVSHVMVGKASSVAKKTNVIMRPKNLDGNGCDKNDEFWDPSTIFKCDYQIKPIS